MVFQPHLYQSEIRCRMAATSRRKRILSDVPLYQHIAFVVTDCNNQTYVIGQHEKPRPIIKESGHTGTPSGDPAVRTYEVTLYAQKSLIPCTTT